VADAACAFQPTAARSPPPAALNVVRLVETGRNARSVDIPGVSSPIAFTPGGDALWLLSADGHLVSRSPAEPAADAAKLALPIQAFIASASPDTRWMVCADRDASVVLVDTQRQQVSPVIRTGHRYPWWAVVSPDGTRIATSGVDAMVRVWAASDGRLLAEWKPVGEAVNAAFSPDGRLLALAKNTGMLEVRDLNRGASAATVVTSSGHLPANAFHPVAPRLFLGGRDGTLHVVDTDHWREITQLKATLGGQPGGLVRNAVSADGKTLAGYSESGVIRLWRREPVP